MSLSPRAFRESPWSEKTQADGVITKGTVIEVRQLGSGRMILIVEMENDKRVSDLVAEIEQKCIAEMDIPRACLRLIWKPPVSLQMPAGFQASPLRGNPLMMEVSATSQALSEACYERANEWAPNDADFCLVCLDPAENADVLGWNRELFCVRCLPESLCKKCKVIVTGQAVCLQCLEESEESLLEAAQLERRRLVTMLFD